MDYGQKCQEINNYFDDQGLSSEKLDELAKNQFSSFDDQAESERHLTSGVRRVVSILEIAGQSRVHRLFSELDAVFGERGKTHIVFESNSGGGEEFELNLS